MCCLHLKNIQDRSLSVLLVEDDEVDVMNVKRAFKKNNMTNPLYVASNGLEALQMLRNLDTESPIIPVNRLLILLDLNMPKMGGIEFLRELRADENLKKIPVVVLTTSNQDQDRVGAYQLNVAGYIIKPVTFSKFVETVGTLNRYWSLCEIP